MAAQIWAKLNALTPIIVSEIIQGYQESLADKLSWKNLFTREIRTNKQEVTLQWVNDMLRLEEQAIGEAPKFKELTGETLTIKLRQWGAAVRINVLDIAADDTGTLLAAAREMGRVASGLVAERIIDCLKNGTTGQIKTYDGENLFSNTHNRNGVAFDNLLAGTFSKATLQSVRTAMAKFPTDVGEPAGLLPTDLIYPVELDIDIREMLESTVVPQDYRSTDNMFRGMMRPHPVSHFSSGVDWYVLHSGVSASQKPFAHVMHRDFAPLRVYPDVGPNSEAFKNHNAAQWWGRTLEDVVPTHPYLMVKVIGA